MADLELLNPRDHGRLRAAKRLSTPHFAQIVPAEFGAAAASRPVVLTKDRAPGRLYAGAMSGLRPGASFAIEPDRQSVVYGKSVSIRVDHGGRCIIYKEKNHHQQNGDPHKKLRPSKLFNKQH